jgi:hypothetical protein
MLRHTRLLVSLVLLIDHFPGPSAVGCSLWDNNRTS